MVNHVEKIIRSAEKNRVGRGTGTDPSATPYLPKGMGDTQGWEGEGPSEVIVHSKLLHTNRQSSSFMCFIGGERIT